MSTLGCTLSTSGSIESSSLETVYQDYGWHEDVVKQQVPIDVCDPCIRFFKEASFSTDIEFKEPTASSIAKRCGLCLRIDSSARPGINWIYSGLKSDQNRYCALKAFRAPFEAEAPWFAVWADEGTPASEKLVTHPPIHGPDFKRVADVARLWLSDCISNHEECRSQCRSETVTRLPTRVLRVDLIDEAWSLRLVQTNNATGRYLALSHCWGPVDKQPLKTTRANLADHLNEIPFRKLPKTFRETVKLAQNIGIEYVWIDSLCIIQDDTEDWQSEARQMASVYSHATLVIAAAGAKDSSQGLFIDERPEERIIHVPYISDGVENGCFSMTYLPYSNPPARGSLNERAWALQEWYLARRILFFMPDGIFWGCKDKSGWGLAEPGWKKDGSLRTISSSWLSLLEDFTKRKLSFPFDCFHALRGIISSMQETRHDQFLFDYGVWGTDLAEQIAWKMDSKIIEKVSLDIPSWSWARTAASKRWCANICHEPFPPFLDITKSIKVNSTGALEATGIMSGTVSVLEDTRRNAFEKISALFEDYPEVFLFPSWSEDHDGSLYLLWNEHTHPRSLGLAVFDNDPSPSPRCFLVATMERSPHISSATNLGLPPDNIQQSDSFAVGTAEGDLNDTNKSPVASSDESNGQNLAGGDVYPSYTSDPMMDPDTKAHYLAHKLVQIASKAKFVYWALLLEPVESDRKFKRVGLALLYPHAKEALNAESMEFEIV